MMLRILAFLSACLIQLCTAQAIAQTCELNAELTRVVTRVETGGTLKLDDGSEVVLIVAIRCKKGKLPLIFQFRGLIRVKVVYPIHSRERNS